MFLLIVNNQCLNMLFPKLMYKLLVLTIPRVNFLKFFIPMYKLLVIPQINPPHGVFTRGKRGETLPESSPDSQRHDGRQRQSQREGEGISQITILFGWKCHIWSQSRPDCHHLG